jgi:RsiW-degrading membrane proteinase PrsW (M82 family)
MTGMDAGPHDAGGTGAALPKPTTPHSKVRSASDAITERLGLDTIDGFSLGSFFSQVFSKHDPELVESMFTVGSRETTPALNPSMGELPNPWIFFRVLVGAVVVYLLFLMAWNQFGNVNVIPGLIMVGSFAVPFSVLILFFEINTPRNVSLVRLIQLVMAGGALSLLISLVLYDKLDFLGVFGASAAGIIEEIGKLAAVLLVMRLLPMSRYPYRINALLFGAAVGTGFAAFESAGYALRIGLNDSSAMLSNITLRGAMSPFGHIVWTAIATSAYWRARHENKDFASTVQSKRFLLLFAAPVALHFIWDMPFDGPFMVKFWVLGFVAWVIIFSLIQSALREISERAGAATVAT